MPHPERNWMAVGSFYLHCFLIVGKADVFFASLRVNLFSIKGAFLLANHNAVFFLIYPPNSV